jgi:vancomycin permeability regulator SanA
MPCGKQRKINKILISGDNGWHGYNEPQDFMDALIALGEFLILA